MCGCLSCAPYWGPAHNPGMCPDWESNRQPFGSQAGVQSTEPHQPGRIPCFKDPSDDLKGSAAFSGRCVQSDHDHGATRQRMLMF